MKLFPDIIRDLKTANGWQTTLDKNFSRKSANYSTLKLTEVKILYDGITYGFPQKIVFDSAFTSQEREITKTEKTVFNGKKIEIIQITKIIPLGFHDRKDKYTGTFSQIITDILGNNLSEEFHYEEGLLSYRDNPLYAVDSKIDWSSYLMVLKSEDGVFASAREAYPPFEPLLENYGIHYSSGSGKSPYILLIFPMQYVKIVENKIMKTQRGEAIFLVLEYNQTALYNPNFNVTIKGQIKNTQNAIIYNHESQSRYTGTKYESFQITPNKLLDTIGYSDFSIRINNIEVDRTKGYYIRSIKANLNVK